MRGGVDVRLQRLGGEPRGARGGSEGLCLTGFTAGILAIYSRRTWGTTGDDLCTRADAGIVAGWRSFRGSLASLSACLDAVCAGFGLWTRGESGGEREEEEVLRRATTTASFLYLLYRLAILRVWGGVGRKGPWAPALNDRIRQYLVLRRDRLYLFS